MKRKRVLVAPLDWGLGHATRCIPIIKMLLQKDFEVLLGGSGQSLALLNGEFPSFPSFILPAYNPYYPKGIFMGFSMVRQLPKFLKAIKNEHIFTQQLVIEEKIDIVISDNRYGCWSTGAYNVFITHQATIRVPLFFYLAGIVINYYNHKQIKKFDTCWIPDFENQFLTGTLANTSLPVRYVGTLSRFTPPVNRAIVYDILILLSGPEPQRSILEEIIIRELKHSNLALLLVRGVHGDGKKSLASSFKSIDFLPTDELQQVIEQSNLVISRPGYSTIMDLARLKKNAFFIPTPAQTEQEYLAARLKENGIANFVKQSKFTLASVRQASVDYTGFKEFNFDEQPLRQAVDELMLLK